MKHSQDETQRSSKPQTDAYPHGTSGFDASNEHQHGIHPFRAMEIAPLSSWDRNKTEDSTADASHTENIQQPKEVVSMVWIRTCGLEMKLTRRTVIMSTDVRFRLIGDPSQAASRPHLQVHSDPVRQIYSCEKNAYRSRNGF